MPDTWDPGTEPKEQDAEWIDEEEAMDRLVFDDDAEEHHGEAFSEPDPTYGKTNEHLDELARARQL